MGGQAAVQGGRKRREYDLEAGRVAASDGDSDDGSELRPLPRGFRALSQLQALRGAPPRVHTAMLHLDRASAFAGVPTSCPCVQEEEQTRKPAF